MLGEKVEAVRKMQEYIESHINDPITLYDLARSCGFSPWYASRIFKELLDKTNNFRLRSCRDLDSMVRVGLFAETNKLCANIMHTAGRGGQRAFLIVQ